MKNDFGLQITYYKDLEELHIEDWHFNSCTYIDIKNENDILTSVYDFIKSYVKEGE